MISPTLPGSERSFGTVLSERRPWHRSVRYPLARLAIAMLVLVSAPALAQGGSEPLEPQGRFEAFRIFAPQLDRDRDIIVYLPPGYDDAQAEHYPVAYFQDGQNVFDRRFFAGRWLDVPRERSWSADLAADARAAAGCPLIIVAIVSEASRAKDYVPFDIAANGFASNAPAYAAFLVETLKPHVDAAYRTRPEATATAAIGSSFGAIFSLYLGFTHPTVFNFVGALSPSVDVGGGAIRTWLEAHPAPDVRVYLDIGTAEAPPEADLANAFQRFAAFLTSLGNDVTLVVADGAPHHESAWSVRLPDVLATFCTSEPRPAYP